MSGRYYVAVESATGDTLPGLPSPMLIQQGGGEAWDSSDRIGSEQPYWRLREDSDPPGTAYTRVRISRACSRCDQAISIGRDSVPDFFGDPMHWQHKKDDEREERKRYG